MQPDLHDALSTRFGELRVMYDGDLRRLAVGRHLIDLPADYIWWVREVWSFEGAEADWALVSWHSGGASCHGGWHMLWITADGTSASPGVEICEGRLLDLRAEADGIEIVQEDQSFAVSQNTYRWDGVEMTRIPEVAPDVPPAGAGQDVTRWIGEHPYMPYRDRPEQMRFATIMSPSDVEDLFAVIGPATEVEQDGDWVLGEGCMAHNCPEASGFWGMRISDGAVVAAILEQGKAPRLFGPVDESPEFRARLAAHGN
jgi:hypothetical protein